MYGRWVEDGIVMHWRLVLDRAALAGPAAP
jgi:hypothetical protein